MRKPGQNATGLEMSALGQILKGRGYLVAKGHEHRVRKGPHVLEEVTGHLLAKQRAARHARRAVVVAALVEDRVAKQRTSFRPTRAFRRTMPRNFDAQPQVQANVVDQAYQVASDVARRGAPCLAAITTLLSD